MMQDSKEIDLEMQVDQETDQLSKADIDKYGFEKRDSPDEDMSSFKENIALAEKDFFHGKASGIKRNLLVQLAVAATVLVAVVITVFFYVRQNRITNMDLFSEYYKSFVKSEKVFEVVRSSDDFYYAVKVFEAGDYARAALLFIQFTDSSEFRAYASFYAGLTCIQLGKWEDAIASLKDASESDDIQIKDVARWYLGLCLLRIDDSGAAREQFKILASSKNEYTTRSRRILRKIQ
jgi:tetratricopeptide (TPR) repeat protein